MYIVRQYGLAFAFSTAGERVPAATAAANKRTPPAIFIIVNSLGVVERGDVDSRKHQTLTALIQRECEWTPNVGRNIARQQASLSPFTRKAEHSCAGMLAQNLQPRTTPRESDLAVKNCYS